MTTKTKGHMEDCYYRNALKYMVTKNERMGWSISQLGIICYQVKSLLLRMVYLAELETKVSHRTS